MTAHIVAAGPTKTEPSNTHEIKINSCPKEVANQRVARRDDAMLMKISALKKSRVLNAREASDGKKLFLNIGRRRA
jgi:hypothetical protein